MSKLKVISNWKDFVLENVDIKKLEIELKENWLDDDGNLVLIDEIGEDYTKQFWERYDVAFDDAILEVNVK